MNNRLFEDNLKALKGYLPKDLVKAFRRSKPARTHLTGRLEDGTLNLSVNGVPLYRPDALTAAAVSVDRYCANPAQLWLPRTRWDGETLPDYSHNRLPREVLSHLQGMELSAEPRGGGAYMICIGLGLGIHLPQLIDRLGFRNLLLVESDSELIYWSMHILPWARIIGILKDRGGDLTIGPAGEPGQTAGALIGSLRGRDVALVDGSYVFQHLETPATNALASAIAETFPILHGTVGFFEDECLMLTHALGNAAALPHRQLTPRFRGHSTLPPAFVVGSGPSLDASMAAIRQHAGDAVIFGAGTGTSALLANGITPQFHCEIENDPNYAAILTEEAERHDYSGISLIAPYIVDPRLPPLFQDVVFYFRELLIPSRLMGKPTDILEHSTPSVSNLACRAAAALGFRDIYLFGVDLGARVSGRQHAADSLYSRNEDWMSLSPLNQPVAGNFGGAAQTNKQFLAARTIFQEFFAQWTKGRAFNCSDGIAIQGAAPLRPEALSLAGVGASPDVVRKGLVEALPAVAAGSLSTGRGLAKYLSGVRHQFKTIGQLIADAKSRPDAEEPVSALHDMLRPLLLGGHLDPAHTVEASVRTTFTGTVIAALQFGRFFEMRMDKDQMAVFFPVFADTMVSELHRLETQFEALFADSGQ